tara:strand:- start:13 stop:279 length:267 start_codon:yes stop_codon:yes gene_type:complete
MSKTDQNKCETEQNKYMQVKTTYARAAIILLAVNFCLTGYVMNGMMKIQDEQADSTISPQPLSTDTATLGKPSSTPQATPQTLEKEGN